MSKSGCCPPKNVISPENGQCSDRFEVMDELNRHYGERIDKIEKTGCTELLISNLKKWIEALVTHDKVLISTIESLESEALKRSEKITQLCKERLEVEDICQKYKKELCEKTDLIKELSCRMKDQAEILNQKECCIKRLNEELDKLRKCLDNFKNKSGNTCEDADLCKMKSQLECLKKELCSRESKIKSLEADLCSCRRKLEEMQDESQESFVEMLGLNEGSRVQMKSKIDTLTAELEEKQCEIVSLENKLEEMNRHALEGKLGELSLQLMDRERDMIILCNKVDYIKRYLDKLHEDEDLSIKCGLKALLLELNEETEWRRKARRSVTSLGDQPESVIIINRSNSLPAESSEVLKKEYFSKNYQLFLNNYYKIKLFVR